MTSPDASPGPSVRGLAGAVVVAFGLGVVARLFGALGWTWLLWLVVGMLGGIAAGGARQWWAAIAGVVAFLVLAGPLGLPRDSGPFWWLGAAASTVAVLLAFVIGGHLALRDSPAGTARGIWRRLGRMGRRAVLGLSALALFGFAGYAAYVGWAGATEFVHPAVRDPDCRTPDLMGWSYEAINYDPADDARLAAANPDRMSCTSQGSPAGTGVISADGIRLAGWYVPSASGAGPSGPTLVVVPGWKTNKSGVVKYGVPFHEAYNLVFVDLRNSGRSGGDETSMGLREQQDVRAIVDWLAAVKHPGWIAAVGNSMGGATALAAAAGDRRIRALILDSMHASILTSTGNVLETEHGQPALPGSWAIVTAVSIMIGDDVTRVDPVQTITRLGERPVLLIQGTRDLVDPPAEASDLNFQAALAAGVPVELQYCRGAGHGRVIETCPTEWAAWSLAFLTRARHADGG